MGALIKSVLQLQLWSETRRINHQSCDEAVRNCQSTDHLKVSLAHLGQVCLRPSGVSGHARIANGTIGNLGGIAHMNAGVVTGNGNGRFAKTLNSAEMSVKVREEHRRSAICRIARLPPPPPPPPPPLPPPLQKPHKALAGKVVCGS